MSATTCSAACPALPCVVAGGAPRCLCGDDLEPGLARPSAAACDAARDDCARARRARYVACNGRAADAALPAARNLLRCDGSCAAIVREALPEGAPGCDDADCAGLPLLNSDDPDRAARLCWNFADPAAPVEVCLGSAYCRGGKCVPRSTAAFDWSLVWKPALAAVATTMASLLLTNLHSILRWPNPKSRRSA